ncbi:NADH:ubiquinone oxidoreductase subunit NDUFA12 [Amaricoccus tamworthensis]|uniref:NADH:ubiquinone oxidoreductase subunit NDUFA12 n=1 Tax=Amaricoccus tamworthensis TaxID=57002 RepID=UPI003C7A8BD6
MSLLSQIFTWWNGQTLGTRFFTWRRGEKVGEDAEGNVYYQSSDGAKRWVIYNGYCEASRVSPEWHGWLHHTWQEPPTERPLTRKPWEKPHKENHTGSAEAYRPAGSILSPAPAVVRNDYEAWSPE